MGAVFSPPAGGQRGRAGRLTAAVVLVALLAAVAEASSGLPYLV
jgi:hypothetical protein